MDRETGQVLRAWRHDGRLFVVGRPGDRYSLRVTNDTDGEVMVVMSVDGVNIRHRRDGGLGPERLCASAHQSYDVTGWRKSTTEVAAFTFAPAAAILCRAHRPAGGCRRDRHGCVPRKIRRAAAAPRAGGAATAVATRAITPAARAALAGPAAGRESERVHDGCRRHRRDRGAPPETPPTNVPAASGLYVAAARRGERRSSLGARRSRPPPSRADEKLGTGHGAREWSVVHNVDLRAGDALTRSSPARSNTTPTPTWSRAA